MPKLPGQVVLVLQGGGALGAYHVGVFQALHEAGIEPDWVIGTSIGAINGAVIAASKPEDRVPRLRELWRRIDRRRGEREARRNALFRQPRCRRRHPGRGHGLRRAAAGVPGHPGRRQAYWDGGLYSNTPVEAVLDDNPRRDSVIFSVNVWQPTGHEPESIWQVLARQKDIQYASRADSHIARQKQIHRLRHVIRELAKNLPAEKQAECAQLAAWGCRTTMHVVRLLAPALEGEDFMKDLDFSAAGIEFRRAAGFADTQRIIERAPWQAPVDPMEGVIVHEVSARTPQ